MVAFRAVLLRDVGFRYKRGFRCKATWPARLIFDLCRTTLNAVIAAEEVEEWGLLSLPFQAIVSGYIMALISYTSSFISRS